MDTNLLKPDYIFETSWEVCNKVGGIHTVISTKALTLSEEYRSNYILIGPDVWRDTSSNPEFQEDPQLFKSWRGKAGEEGLHIRIGHWNIAGSPIVVIVDFQSFTLQKDAVFAKFWETYKLDSLSGQWDYVEPALFGYAAGKVVESFVRFNLTIRDTVLAQFHEWMTGTGLLYLRSAMPQIATVFTTHATVLGRSIAGNLLPLYGGMTTYNPDLKASEFNVVAKQSLEKLSAFHANAFTTVSGITGNECSHFLGKDVDIVTPNGFEDSFVPQGEDYDTGRAVARGRMLDVAKALFGKVDGNPLFVGVSGRYEFKNKGIDIFVKSLGELKRNYAPEREIIAFVFIPANHYGPRRDLQSILVNSSMKNTDGKILTHNLHDAEFDPTLREIQNAGLTNAADEKVKVIFVPCYLNGDDGIFNIAYYRLLIGLDLTVFPSYYEPWGYTPLESVAFHIPTVTTTLAGFGLWVKEKGPANNNSVRVIDRNDTNDAEVVTAIADAIHEFSAYSSAQEKAVRNAAFEMSRIALWSNFISYYRKAYDIALRNVQETVMPYTAGREFAEDIPHVDKYQSIDAPKWKRMLINKNIPEKLKPLDELANNLWWSWNDDAGEMFESIDPIAWRESGHNPVVFLGLIPYDRLIALEGNVTFMTRLNYVYERFVAYMQEKEQRKSPKIAYFSMEYGLHTSLKIYSGGLGILAGDYLKEASDLNANMVAVGLLYRYGYFQQVISANGEQMAFHDSQDFTRIPAIPIRDEQGNWRTISIVFPGRTLYARIWKVQVGRIDLYLLDTDFEDNTEYDRSITHHLYGGGEENRFKQEILLGIGGIRALRTMGLYADVYHCNEGHAAFIGIERLFEYIHHNNLTFAEALEIIRASSLFTTHTPVPAGHDSFTEGMLRMYVSHYPAKLKISWEQFMGLGKINASDPNERFSMSFLAANLSQAINGVSRLHGRVSQEIFAPMWPGYIPEELNVGYVTNGVHFPTWTAPEWKQLYEKYFGVDFISNQLQLERWNRIYEVPDREIWHVRSIQRQKMMDYMKEERLSSPMSKNYQSPKYIVEVAERFNKSVLTIGFARRFATYKRAHLLFRNLERLASIVNNNEMPVQFIFAGKAHPADKAGQDLIKMIVEISKRPEFMGRIVFLQNYDMELASHLVSGVDVWLNTPTRPLEASGTSGEKAVMNGVLHFSVLDGWWAEGYTKDAGWMLPEESAYDNSDAQDELDAEMIYNLIENELAPLYYSRDNQDVPVGWVRFIKNSIAKVASNFTTTRMFNDYMTRYYKPLHARKMEMLQNEYELAKDMSSWKKKVFRSWESIEILSAKTPDILREPIMVGQEYRCEVVVDLNELSPDDIGIEFLVVEMTTESNRVKLHEQKEFRLAGVSGRTAVYEITMLPYKTGAFEFGIRMFPKNPNLPHRQDFSLLKWI